MSETEENVKDPSEFGHVGAATMQGDLMKCIVDELKLIDEPWQKLSEEHQGEILDRIEKQTEGMITKCISIIAGGNQVSVAAEVDSVKFKSGVQITLKSKSDAQGVLDLAEHAGGQVRVVILDVGEYISDDESKPGVDADQGSLGLGDKDSGD